MKIGLVGTGMLGNAVGLHLLENGMDVVAQNRTMKKTKNLKDCGATIVSYPSQVADQCTIIITCVKNASIVRHIAFEENGISNGKYKDLTVCDMSTIDPISSKQIAEKFVTYGINMLDIPVMGGPNVAIKGELIMMASGKKEIFLKHKKIFDVIASKVFYLGKNGTAHSIKLAMNIQIAMLALSLSEGITLARKSLIDPKIFLEILNSTYFQTGMSRNKAYKMIDGIFDPTFLLRNLKKDLYTINKYAESCGLKLPMSGMAERIYQNATDEGFGDLDYTGILAYLQKHTKFKTHKD